MTTATLDTATEDTEALLADGLLSIDETCKFLKISRSSVYQATLKGTLRCVRLPGQRSVRIPKRAAIDFAAKGLTAPSAE